jgi:hypothetical protein
MWLNRAVPADREDIDRRHDISWGHYPTRAATPVAAGTLPTTHGADLRGIGFVDLHGPTGLVVELRDEASIARLADGLSLAWCHVLRGIIEWLAYIAGRTGESVSDFARRFVHQIVQATARLTTLQALPAARAFGHARLPLTEAGQVLVAPLYGRLLRHCTVASTTLVIAVLLQEASAKVRTGPPKDAPGDDALHVWAGELPLSHQAHEPIPDPQLAPDIPVPEYVRHYRR